MKRKTIEVACLLLGSVLLLAGSNAIDSVVDYARLQKKVSEAPPMGLAETIQAYLSKSNAWPVSKQQLIAFESQTYGISNCVAWDNEKTLTFKTQKDGTLILIHEYVDGDGFTIHTVDSIRPPVPVDIRAYFARWRAGNTDIRYRLKRLEFLDKVLTGETEQTTVALLGKPDQDGVSIPEEYSKWWHENMKKLLLYKVTETQTHYTASLRVWVQKDGKIYSVDDGHWETQQTAAASPVMDRQKVDGQ